MKFLNNKTILITGGTGSFGKALLRKILFSKLNIKKLLYSVEMNLSNIPFKVRLILNTLKNKIFLGDVRDKERLKVH